MSFLTSRRVHNDVETCRACGGTTKVIACIEDRVVIEKILAHLQGKDTSLPTNLLPAKPGATCRPVWLTPSNPSLHSNGNDPKSESQDSAWPDARGSCVKSTGEGDWLGGECGMGQDFGVVAGRSSLRYRWMIR